MFIKNLNFEKLHKKLVITFITLISFNKSEKNFKK